VNTYKIHNTKSIRLVSLRKEKPRKKNPQKLVNSSPSDPLNQPNHTNTMADIVDTTNDLVEEPTTKEVSEEEVSNEAAEVEETKSVEDEEEEPEVATTTEETHENGSGEKTNGIETNGTKNGTEVTNGSGNGVPENLKRKSDGVVDEEKDTTDEIAEKKAKLEEKLADVAEVEGVEANGGEAQAVA